MKMKKVIQMTRDGFKDASRFGLDKPENWTPLYIYIHVSRLIIGTILGVILGILLMLTIKKIAG